MNRVVLITFLSVLLIIPSGVLADVGIGLRWETEAQVIKENSKSCVTYFLYNPFDQDVNGFIKAYGNISDLAIAEDPKIIPAGTLLEDAVPTQICFHTPDVYQENCLLGVLMCERTCSATQQLYPGNYTVTRTPEGNIQNVVYAGDVQAAYDLNFAGGTGSATGSSISARMRVIVNCEKLEMDMIPLYVIIVVIVIVVLFLVYRKKRGKGERKIKTKNPTYSFEFKPK